MRVHAALEHPQYDVVKNVQYAYVPGKSDYGAQTSRGVIRLERNYAPIAAEIHDDFLTQAITIALALVALYLAMLPIMRRVARSLQRSYVERAELAAIVDHSNDAIIALSSDGRDHVVERRRGDDLRLALGRGPRQVHRVPACLTPPSPVSSRSSTSSHVVHVRKDGKQVVDLGDDVADSRLRTASSSAPRSPPAT